MKPLTHLIQTPSDGIIAVPADDPKASSLDVVDTAPEGHHYALLPRTPEQMDKAPKDRRWILKPIPAQAVEELPQDALWYRSGTGEQQVGNRAHPPPGKGWSLRAVAAAGEQFTEDARGRLRIVGYARRTV